MKTILLLRHAKSSWKNALLHDHDRPLNDRGERDAPRMGELLRKMKLVPDCIFCSTAVRAMQTAELFAEASGFIGQITPCREYYLAEPAAYLLPLNALPPQIERAMIIGHNPGMEILLKMLTGVEEAMPTAALAHIELGIETWTELDTATEGKLLHLWKPKELPK